MSNADPIPEQAQALRRGLSVRIGVALAALAGVAIVAVVALTRSETGSAGAPVAGATAPVALAQKQPEPSAPAHVIEAAPLPASGAASVMPANEPSATAAAPGFESVIETKDAKDGGQSNAQTAAVGASISADKHSGSGAPTTATVAKAESNTAQADAKSPQVDVRSAQADAKASASTAAPSPPVGSKPVRGPRLQAGVFLQAANAQAFKSNLEAQGFPVYIESRVHIGPFKNRKEAERAREKLREMGVTTVLIAQ